MTATPLGRSCGNDNGDGQRRSRSHLRSASYGGQAGDRSYPDHACGPSFVA